MTDADDLTPYTLCAWCLQKDALSTTIAVATIHVGCAHEHRNTAHHCEECYHRTIRLLDTGEIFCLDCYTAPEPHAHRCTLRQVRTSPRSREDSIRST